MPSMMPAFASDRARTFLIVALSGRALAESAGRAGHPCIVLDLFNDLDTQAAAETSTKAPGTLGTGFDDDALVELAGRLAPPGAGLVYGSGFESRPALLSRLAAGHHIYGNSPETLDRVKNPAWFFATLERLGIPHPETRLDQPMDGGAWLAKKTGAAGGAHIRNAGDDDDSEVRPGFYFQRRLPGRSVSALFVADGKTARVLGFSEQWASAGSEDKPFRFAGAAFPAALTDALKRAIADVVAALAEEAGLVGVNSVDMLIDRRGFHILEINPRPGATLEIFDRGLDVSLFDLHVRACEGTLPTVRQQPVVTFASEIVYAIQTVEIPPSRSWPDWAADLPAGGTRIDKGEPVCTVLATGQCLDETRTLVRQRADEILAAFAGEHRPPMANDRE